LSSSSFLDRNGLPAFSQRDLLGLVVGQRRRPLQGVEVVLEQGFLDHRRGRRRLRDARLGHQIRPAHLLPPRG
jgi:hypothetical protein